MAIYRTGQASMDAQGYITGYGTKWREQLTLIRAGATIMFLTNPVKIGVITEVVSDTSIRAITTGGEVVSRTDYVILLHDSLTVDGLAQDVAETLRYYQGKETEFAHFIEFLETFDFAKLESLTNQTIESAAAAKVSETNAKASENAALASQNAAKTSETNAKASENAALASKNAAKTSETNAKASETNAASSKAAAANSAAEALASQNAAKTSETNAKTSETNAESSKAAAANSANAAAASQAAAASSASAAKTSQDAAKASETAAKESETAAKSSETNAKSSENKAKEYMETAQSIASPMTQYDWPLTTSNNAKYIKIAKLTDPGQTSCHLTLMITNGGNFGSPRGSVDILDASARGLGSNDISAANVRTFMQVRRIGDKTLDNSNQLRYGLVKGDGYFEIWAYQRAFITETKVAILAKTARVDLYIPSGSVSQDDIPSGYVESQPIRIYDELNKPTTTDLGITLGTAASKDYGTASGQLMPVGAFGLGGKGLSYSSVQSNADLINKLKANGGQYWRAARASGANVDINDHGSGFYSYCGDTHTAINVQYNTGIVRVLATTDSNLANDIVYTNTLYGTANKPSKSDVGLGNVTNDEQVKKAGDSMTGDLQINKSYPALRLKATDTNNALIWFRNSDDSERGVVWAPANTEDLGEVHIRAKNTAGVSSGDFIVRSDGRIEARDLKISYAISAKTLQLSNDDTNTGVNNFSISGNQHTPIMLTRNSDANVSIGFKLNKFNTKRLGVDADGDLAYGENENLANNSKVMTRKMLEQDLTMPGVWNFTNGVMGPIQAEILNDKTVDLNDLMIKASNKGTIKVYQCTSQGGGNNITNKPSGVSGNFILYVESIRKVTDTDFTNRQVLYGSESSREFTRYCSNGTWSAWRESVVSGLSQDVSVKTLSATGRLSGGELAVGGNGALNGNLSVGAGNVANIPTQDNGIVMKSGAMVREASDGRLILSSVTGARRLTLRPAGASVSDNQVEVYCSSASGGDTKIEFAQGAGFRCNSSGSPIISAKAGQMMYFRPSGDTSSTGQTTIDGSGNMTVNGGFTAAGDASVNNIAVNGQTTTESLVASGGATVGRIELMHATPYIDFHFNNSSSDYTTRLIENASGELTLEGAFMCKRHLYAWGAIMARNVAPSNPGNGTLVTGAPVQSMLQGRGAYGDARGAVSSMYMEERVGENHRTVLYLDGFGRTDAWLFNAGGVIDTPIGSVQTSGSDVRIKTDFVEPAAGARDRILKLGVSEFKMIGDDRVRRGFIAQQADTVDEVYTFQGSEMDVNGEKIKILNVDQTAIMADMVTTIQEQDAEIKSLKAEIEELREMVKAMLK